jgi:hypothetical protein
MTSTDLATDAMPSERYASLSGFYSADQRRVRSRELDVGLWWREDGDGPLHRAAWVADTGELYLVRLGAPADGGGQVELLALVGSRERLEDALDGWREQCGGPHSLDWLRERLDGLCVCPPLRSSASAGSAPDRPAGQAPMGRRSRRTGGTAGVRRDRGRAYPGAPPPAGRRTGHR